MKKTARQDEIEEIIGTVGQTFVGLTVNCARCHNHKFDPIQQKEYYQMTSAIAGVFHGERSVADPELARQREVLRKQIASLSEELARIENRARETALAKRKHRDPKEKPEPPTPFARWNLILALRTASARCTARPRETLDLRAVHWWWMGVMRGSRPRRSIRPCAPRRSRRGWSWVASTKRAAA